MARLTATEQEMYSTIMLSAMKTDAGGALTKYAQTTIGKAKKATFYQIVDEDVLFVGNDIENSDGTAGKAMNLYANNGAGASTKKIEVTLTEVKAGENVSQEEIDSTELDVKSDLFKAQSRKIGRHKDKQVLDALAASANINKVTYTKGKTFADDEVVKVLLTNIALAKVRANANPDYTGKIAVIMNFEDQAALFGNTKFTSSDFGKMIHGEGMSAIMGLEVIGYNALVPKGTVYIVPDKTIGVASSSDSDYAGIEWAHGITAYQLVARTYSAAAVVIPDGIFSITEATT